MIADRPGAYPVASTTQRMHGLKWDVVTDVVRLPGGDEVHRDVVRHPSAVAVLALDDADRALVVHQYRHPVEATLWEVPAGLLDVAGEDPLAAARRELFEETHHVASTWAVLVDFCTSPGFCDEALRVYLVRDVELADAEPHDRVGEERDMPVEWVPLDELRDALLAGRLHNPSLAVGVLAACASREQRWATLRPADSPWSLGPRQLRTL